MWRRRIHESTAAHSDKATWSNICSVLQKHSMPRFFRVKDFNPSDENELSRQKTVLDTLLEAIGIILPNPSITGDDTIHMITCLISSVPANHPVITPRACELIEHIIRNQTMNLKARHVQPIIEYLIVTIRHSTAQDNEQFLQALQESSLKNYVSQSRVAAVCALRCLGCIVYEYADRCTGIFENILEIISFHCRPRGPSHVLALGQVLHNTPAPPFPSVAPVSEDTLASSLIVLGNLILRAGNRIKHKHGSIFPIVLDVLRWMAAAPARSIPEVEAAGRILSPALRAMLGLLTAGEHQVREAATHASDDLLRILHTLMTFGWQCESLQKSSKKRESRKTQNARLSDVPPSPLKPSTPGEIGFSIPKDASTAASELRDGGSVYSRHTFRRGRRAGSVERRSVAGSARSVVSWYTHTDSEDESDNFDGIASYVTQGGGKSKTLIPLRVRVTSLQCIAAVSRLSPRILYGRWDMFIPQIQGTHKNPFSPSFLTIILHDTSKRVREAAAFAFAALLDGAPLARWVALPPVTGASMAAKDKKEKASQPAPNSIPDGSVSAAPVGLQEDISPSIPPDASSQTALAPTSNRKSSGDGVAGKLEAPEAPLSSSSKSGGIPQRNRAFHSLSDKTCAMTRESHIALSLAIQSTNPSKSPSLLGALLKAAAALCSSTPYDRVPSPESVITIASLALPLLSFPNATVSLAALQCLSAIVSNPAVDASLRMDKNWKRATASHTFSTETPTLAAATNIPTELEACAIVILRELVEHCQADAAASHPLASLNSNPLSNNRTEILVTIARAARYHPLFVAAIWDEVSPLLFRSFGDASPQVRATSLRILEEILHARVKAHYVMEGREHSASGDAEDAEEELYADSEKEPGSAKRTEKATDIWSRMRTSLSAQSIAPNTAESSAQELVHYWDSILCPAQEASSTAITCSNLLTVYLPRAIKDVAAPVRSAAATCFSYLLPKDWIHALRLYALFPSTTCSTPAAPVASPVTSDPITGRLPLLTPVAAPATATNAGPVPTSIVQGLALRDSILQCFVDATFDPATTVRVSVTRLWGVYLSHPMWRTPLFCRFVCPILLTAAKDAALPVRAKASWAFGNLTVPPTGHQPIVSPTEAAEYIVDEAGPVSARAVPALFPLPGETLYTGKIPTLSHPVQCAETLKEISAKASEENELYAPMSLHAPGVSQSTLVNLLGLPLLRHLILALVSASNDSDKVSCTAVRSLGFAVHALMIHWLPLPVDTRPLVNSVVEYVEPEKILASNPATPDRPSRVARTAYYSKAQGGIEHTNGGELRDKSKDYAFALGSVKPQPMCASETAGSSVSKDLAPPGSPRSQDQDKLSRPAVPSAEPLMKDDGTSTNTIEPTNEPLDVPLITSPTTSRTATPPRSYCTPLSKPKRSIAPYSGSGVQVYDDEVPTPDQSVLIAAPPNETSPTCSLDFQIPTVRRAFDVSSFGSRVQSVDALAHPQLSTATLTSRPPSPTLAPASLPIDTMRPMISACPDDSLILLSLMTLSEIIVGGPEELNKRDQKEANGENDTAGTESGENTVILDEKTPEHQDNPESTDADVSKGLNSKGKDAIACDDESSAFATIMEGSSAGSATAAHSSRFRSVSKKAPTEAWENIEEDVDVREIIAQRLHGRKGQLQGLQAVLHEIDGEYEAADDSRLEDVDEWLEDAPAVDDSSSKPTFTQIAHSKSTAPLPTLPPTIQRTSLPLQPDKEVSVTVTKEDQPKGASKPTSTTTSSNTEPPTSTPDGTPRTSTSSNTASPAKNNAAPKRGFWQKQKALKQTKSSTSRDWSSIRSQPSPLTTTATQKNGPSAADTEEDKPSPSTRNTQAIGDTVPSRDSKPTTSSTRAAHPPAPASITATTAPAPAPSNDNTDPLATHMRSSIAFAPGMKVRWNACHAVSLLVPLAHQAVSTHLWQQSESHRDREKDLVATTASLDLSAATSGPSTTVHLSTSLSTTHTNANTSNQYTPTSNDVAFHYGANVQQLVNPSPPRPRVRKDAVNGEATMWAGVDHVSTARSPFVPKPIGLQAPFASAASTSSALQSELHIFPLTSPTLPTQSIPPNASISQSLRCTHSAAATQPSTPSRRTQGVPFSTPPRLPPTSATSANTQNGAYVAVVKDPTFPSVTICSNWVPLTLAALHKALTTCSNFKVRIAAAQALGAIPSRESYRIPFSSQAGPPVPPLPDTKHGLSVSTASAAGSFPPNGPNARDDEKESFFKSYLEPALQRPGFDAFYPAFSGLLQALIRPQESKAFNEWKYQDALLGAIRMALVSTLTKIERADYGRMKSYLDEYALTLFQYLLTEESLLLPQGSKECEESLMLLHSLSKDPAMLETQEENQQPLSLEDRPVRANRPPAYGTLLPHPGIEISQIRSCFIKLAAAFSSRVKSISPVLLKMYQVKAAQAAVANENVASISDLTS